jgi:site-specific DNA recombinase
MVAPVGYLNDHTTKVIYPDPDRAPFILKAYELYATGTFTIDRLRETVNGLGLRSRNGKAPSRSQYHRILENPLYCGIIDYGNESYEAKHEPIVSLDLFDEVQAVMARKANSKDVGLKPYLYRGLFRCGECGCFITTETQKGHNYVHCTKRVKKNCSQPYLREEDVSRQVSDVLSRITIRDDWAEWMLQELGEEQEHAHAAHEEQLRLFTAKVEGCEQKLKKLLDLHLNDELDVDEYRMAKSDVLAEKAKMRARLAASEEGEHTWFEPCIRFVKVHMRSHFMAVHAGKIEEERETLKKTGSNLLIEEKTLAVDFQEPWKTVEKYGRLAHPDAALVHTSAPCVGEPSTFFTSAERGRFEFLQG